MTDRELWGVAEALLEQLEAARGDRVLQMALIQFALLGVRALPPARRYRVTRRRKETQSKRPPRVSLAGPVPGLWYYLNRLTLWALCDVRLPSVARAEPQCRSTKAARKGGHVMRIKRVAVLAALAVSL